ncbi:MAG TPA: hypothetical protein VLJ76_02665 [Gaiellaceae bacterium]|nr:hypothetical protein [Gaiellaceae bacterium]
MAVVVVLVILGSASSSSGSGATAGTAFDFSVGTFYWGGLFNMTTFAFHDIGSGLPSDVTIVGPNGWNSDQAFDCHLEHYPNMAPGLGICLAETAPWQGTYKASVAGTPAASATLLPVTYASPAPVPRASNVSSSGVTVSWTPDPHFRSYLVLVSLADAACCQVATVVPAGASSVDVRTGLVEGREYSIELETFPVDLTTAQGLTTPWNVSAFRAFFSLSDTVAPVAHATTSSGKAGNVHLRYSVSDNSGKAYVVGRLTTRSGRKLLSWRTGYEKATGLTNYYHLWSGRLTGRFTFCVTAYDAAKNASRQSCAAVIVR